MGRSGIGWGYGPGLAAQGERVAFEWGDETLIVRPGETQERRIPYQAIGLRPSGFDRAGAQLTWMDGGPWALALDEGAWRALRADPPQGLRREIERFDAQTRRGRFITGLGWSLIAALVLLPVLAGVMLWWQADRLIGAAVDRIPVPVEQRLGDAAYAQLTLGANVLESGPAVDAVAAIGQRLAAATESPYTLRWHVVDDPQVNAFAVPGGHVVVFTGLLGAARSADEVAGVLAHEAQHVVLRHSLRGLVQSLGLRAAIALLFGDMGSLSGAGELAARLGSLRFGREQETAADVHGLALLRRARIDPAGMPAFFETLAAREGGGIALLSTHPMSAERAARLRAEIARAGSWPADPLPVDWPAVKAAVKPS